MSQMSIATRADQGKLTKDDLELLSSLESTQLVEEIYASHIFAVHRNSHLSIFVQKQAIRNRKSYNSTFVKAKAVLDKPGLSINRTEIDCVIFFSDWSMLENYNGERINILDLFPSLYSKKGRGIGICTFQNGIQNTLEDFEKMGSRIFEKFRFQKPLCMIGFYNKTSGIMHGLLKDLRRLSNEWKLNVDSILMMRQIIYTFSLYLPQNILWVHFCHSEAGLIANEIMTNAQCTLGVSEASFVRKQLITFSYGAVAPIPSYVLEAVNTYSVEDIAMWFARKYLDKVPKPSTVSDKELKEVAKKIYDSPMTPKQGTTPDTIFAQLKNGVNQWYIDKYPYESRKNGYDITLVESLGGYGVKVEGDHAFDGATYQAVLATNILDLKRKYQLL